MNNDFFEYQLSNGLKAIHRSINSPVGHCCIMIRTGTRNEHDDEHGLAHFIEHSLFKGTKNKSANTVLNRLDNLGGEINAYTTKEETCIYATFLINDFDAAFDLVADITFNATFPEKELEKEKTVIIDEIQAYRDSPAEEIYDRFEEILFTGHPLGHDILGTEESVKSFNSIKCRNFIQNNYSIDQMLFASIGNISTELVKKKVEKWFSKQDIKLKNASQIKIQNPENQAIHTHILQREVSQTHVIMGQKSYPLDHTLRPAMFLFNNMLGGPAMNSILNMAIRERKGYTYTIESHYASYSDTGLFHIYFGSENKAAEKCKTLVIKELKKLMQTPVADARLSVFKRQLLGQVAIARENSNALMLSAAKNYLFLNWIETFDSLKAKINAVTPEHIMQVANEVANVDELYTLTFKSSD